MATYASNGQKLSTVAQTNIYTANVTGLKDIRSEGEIKIGSSVVAGVVPATVFADSNDQEKPATFNQYVEDAFTFSSLIRMATAAAGTPFLVSAFESGGYTVATPNDDTTIATYTNTTTYTLTDTTTTAAGEFRTIELSNGQFLPMLFAVDGAAGAITGLFALPSLTAGGKAVKKTWTITPGQPAPVPDAKFLTMVHTDRTNATSNRAVQGTGCWLASVGDLTVEPGTLPKLELKFSAADLSENAAGIDTLAAANEFLDAEPVKVTDAPYVLFGTSTPGGNIAATSAVINKATISFGKTCEKIDGMGGSTCINNIQGAMGMNSPCAVTLEMILDSTRISDWDAGTNASKAIAIIQPSTGVTVPAWSFVVPKAHIMEAVTTDYGSNSVKIIVKYTAIPAGLNSITTYNAQENQPWYFGIQDRSA